jgi:hypothetical protein
MPELAPVTSATWPVKAYRGFVSGSTSLSLELVDVARTAFRLSTVWDQWLIASLNVMADITVGLGWAGLGWTGLGWAGIDGERRFAVDSLIPPVGTAPISIG